jgi:integrase
VPTFAELVRRYFESSKFSRLKGTTQKDRHSHLKAGGSVMVALGAKRVDEITADTLVDWWENATREQRQDPTRKDWSTETGFRYLSSIAEVLKVGRRYLTGRVLPTIEARQRIGEVRRTAGGRAAGGPDVRPIEDPKTIERLVGALEEDSLELAAFTLLLLDGGLRKGKALALRWRQIAWGTDEDDTRRHLVIDRSRSRGTEEGTTKSGLARRVGLSRRLRAKLADHLQEQRPASLDALLCPTFESEEKLRRAWNALLVRADLPGLRWKDLRDTFASQLLTVGVSIQWVSKQLGHGSIGVTETHYAKYLGAAGDEFVYVEPARLRTGEVPADLLNRLPDCIQTAYSGDPFGLPDSLKSLNLQ